MTLKRFREHVAQTEMTSAERRQLLDQAQLIVDQLYVHLEHKKSMYGIDPGQQLRLLARRQTTMDDAAFHRELLRIFDGLRDMHTSYVLPEPYRGRVFLGFAVERYWDAEREPHYIVSKQETDELAANERAAGESEIPIGAEITHWNGMPIEIAVQRNAESEAGGNPAARFARGLESLTVRNAALSPLPTEDYVYVDYTVDGEPDGRRVNWMVTPDADPLIPEGGEEVESAAGRRMGFSVRTEMARRTKANCLQPRTRNGAQTVQVLETELDDEEVRARIIKTDSGRFGHLRIYTFHIDGGRIDRFLAEVRRLLRQMPEKGLILDVRGNGGGYIEAAEGLLGLLTGSVRPEPAQFINSAFTYELCGRSRDLVRWRDSIAESAETGELYSARFPLSEVPANEEPYPGPVVLITDALVYSATDMLAAGFQDNGIGWVLGVDDNTGAGGANVWTHRLLRTVWPEGPFQPLPRGARLYVALRRTLRVGRFDGRPVEDLGVYPDVSYRMTKNDVIKQNVDLMNRAGNLLLDLAEQSPARPGR
jgi:C-terminal processing protease CtpA/Prc